MNYSNKLNKLINDINSTLNSYEEKKEVLRITTEDFVSSCLDVSNLRTLLYQFYFIRDSRELLDSLSEDLKKVAKEIRKRPEIIPQLLTDYVSSDET